MCIWDFSYPHSSVHIHYLSYTVVAPTYTSPTDYFLKRSTDFSWKKKSRGIRERTSERESPLTSFWPVWNLSLSLQRLSSSLESKREWEMERTALRLDDSHREREAHVSLFFLQLWRGTMFLNTSESKVERRERQQSQALGSEQASEKLAANIFPLKSSSKAGPDVPTC